MCCCCRSFFFFFSLSVCSMHFVKCFFCFFLLLLCLSILLFFLVHVVNTRIFFLIFFFVYSFTCILYRNDALFSSFCSHLLECFRSLFVFLMAKKQKKTTLKPLITFKQHTSLHLQIQLVSLDCVVGVVAVFQSHFLYSILYFIFFSASSILFAAVLSVIHKIRQFTNNNNKINSPIHLNFTHEFNCCQLRFDNGESQRTRCK